MFCPNVGPISCLISCEFRVFFLLRFLVGLIICFYRVSRKRRPRKQSSTEVKVNNSFVRLRIVPIFPQG